MTPKHRILGKYDVPVEVVSLIEDMVRLDAMLGFLHTIDPWNVTESLTEEQREFGKDMLQAQRALVESWRRYAKRKLMKYLAP